MPCFEVLCLVLLFYSKKATSVDSDDDFLNNLEVPSELHLITGLPYVDSTCIKTTSCGNSGSKYRTFDGSCNNQYHASWGAANTSYNRFLQAKYADGKSAFLLSASRKPLPLARKLSWKLFPDKPIDDQYANLLFMFFGQFVAHDMSLSKRTVTTTPNCCDKANTNNAKCMPTIAPNDDPFYGPLKVSCITAVRGDSDLTDGCNKGGAAQPLVEVSHFVDLSHVYGSSSSLSHELREHSGGRLVLQNQNGQLFPPQAPNPSVSCPLAPNTETCFSFGDRVRGNQTPLLAALQILFVREHNRVANALANLGNGWDDERLYLEARNVVIAEYCQIVYFEYLVQLLGNDYVDWYGILEDEYNPQVNPSVLVEHATAASRMYHSAIQAKFQLVSEAGEVVKTEALSDHFLRPKILLNEGYDQVMRGMITEPQEQVDRYMTGQVTNLLFRGTGKFGNDLRALDINRGRDHGLAKYNDYRELFGFGRAENFDGLKDLIDAKVVDELASLYETVDDVELLTAGSLEIPLPGIFVGPTFQIILLEQFYRSKIGDAYSHFNNDNLFTEEQLIEIQKSSIARIICDNTKIGKIQRYAFYNVFDNENPVIPCSEIPSLDFTAWKETP